ncbi:membrane protein [Skermanella stibiiresistens SB22]|uniref:Membrane protein n=1 Tax=Skermanella stibiiresistens SB22 TaxID=1385369 RepID=W9GY62_9PROT|nr:ABC transporter permease [Skermanella stibiiresistens]EWY38870.1 membrane protein [Skermanella stibiiresistens SB22]
MIAPGAARRLRLFGLVRKETLQILRDPSSLLIAFVLPVVLLLLFGYGVSLDANNVRVTVVVENPTPEAERFIASFANSPYLEVSVMRHRADAEADLVAGRADGVVVLRADFAARLERLDTAPIQLLLDGTEANTARIVRGYAEGVWSAWARQEAMARGRVASVPVVAEPRIWFNPELRSRNFLVPGLIAIIMTLIGTLLTSLVVAREWERGTMEALIATQTGLVELLAGKLVPYFVLGMLAMTLSVAMAVFQFGVPIRGSIAVLFGVAAVFLIGALAMGLFISTVTRNQFVAGQVAIVSGFLPAFMLSGFVFEIGSMPGWIQVLTHAVAARYFVSTLQTLFLAGTIWPVILPDLGAMALIALVFLSATAARTRKRLD